MKSWKLSSLTLFFPAHNEAGNIGKTIQEADRVAQNVAGDYEIIVVNDGSTDQTAAIVKDLTARYSHLRLVSHPQNQGYGAALLSGFDVATKDWIFFSDADLQFDLAELTRLVEYADQHAVVIGYRARRSEGFVRHLNAWGWKLLNRLLFGLTEARDIDCAFKLIKASAIKPLLPQIISRGAMISAEILIRLKRGGHEIKEIPVKHFPRPTGQASGAKPQVILRAFKEMAQVFTNINQPSHTGTVQNAVH